MLAALLALLSASLGQAKSVDAQKLSLPQGPASVEGLGRAFTPSLGSGISAYGVDITFPPAVGGFGPKLALEYDSGGGVTELGIGWHIGGLVSIRRGVNDGLPRFDSTDAFELVGLGMTSELLESGTRTYRPEHETGSFARARRSKDGETWEVRDKSGTLHRLGGSGFVEAEGARVATYLLREQSDLHGHVIRYEWATRSGYALLTRVTWNGDTAEAQLELLLHYEARPDTVALFSAGIRQVLDQRLKDLEVRYGGELVRRTTLSYGDGIHPQLTSVNVVGTDGRTALPELSFQYTQPRYAADGQLVTMTSPPLRSLSDPDVALADLNGDSLPDLLVTSAGDYRSYVNHDGVAWQEAELWTAGESPSVALGAQGAELADLDGDGAIDLVVKSGAREFRYFPVRGSGQFAPSVEIASKPNFTFEDPDVRLADMDGDRRADVVVTTAAGLAVGYNLTGQDWTLPETVGLVDEDQPLRFSDGHTQLCEVNGDRMPDLCYLRSGSLVFWLGRGRGAFEPPETTSNVPAWDPSSPWQLRDLNGDGWDDLVHVGVGEVAYALSPGIGRFEAIRHITGTPENLRTTTARFADMNGSGTMDVLWVDTTGEEQRVWQYLELFPSGRGGLLTKIDNGLGKVVRVTYAPAAEYAARAREAGRPWTTRLNVALPVVSRIEVDSSLGELLGDPTMVTEYGYADGTWDAKERSFAGFRSGLEKNVGDHNTATLVTETSFDVGVPHRVLRGSPLSSVRRTQSGHVFARSTQRYTIVTLDTATDGQVVEYGYRSSERVEHIDGKDAAAGRTVLTEWEQDEFGNTTLEAQWGEVVGDDKLEGDDERITRRTYANNAQDWVLGRLASEEVEDGLGHRLASKQHYYDGAAFQGLALGEVTRGDLRRVDSWISGEHVATEAAYDHDDHGNVTVAIDARGGRSEYEYDAPSHAFVVAERRFPNASDALTWRGTYDPRFGVPTRITDPNGGVTELRYDALGRITKIIKPGDSLERPTLSYSYHLASPLSRTRTEERETSGNDGTLVSLDYVDGLGRKRGQLVESARAASWTLSELSLVDARGNKAFVAYPTEEQSPDLPAIGDRQGTGTEYDAMGRVIATRHADGSSVQVSYGPLARTVWDENDSDPESVHANTPTRRLSDGLGRLRKVVEREGVREITTGSYAYDALGNLTDVRDALGSVRKYRYDGRSRRIEIEDPNAGTWELSFTEGNDLQQRIDPAGHVVRWTYDRLGRVTEEWHRKAGEAHESLAVEHHYDVVSSEHPECEHLKGQLSWARDEAGAVFLSYTERGLVAARTRRWVDGTEHVTWNGYDAAERPIRRGFPDQTYLSLTYDSGGRLSAMGPVIPAVEWSPHGALSQAKLGNGVVDRREYDPRQRLVRMAATDAKGQRLRDLAFTLDAASRITQVEDLRPKVPEAERLSMAFTFDDRYRLTEAKDAVASTRYLLDDMGKLLSVESTHEAAWLNVENAYGENGAGPDQLTHHGSRAFSYDAAGRMLDDGERSLQWDAMGRLKKLRRGSVVEEYTYGYDGKRAVKTTTTEAGTAIVRYIDEDVEQRGGRLVRYAWLEGERVARLDALSGEPTGAVGPAPRASTPPASWRPASWVRGWWLLLVALGGATIGLLLSARRVPRLAFSATCIALLAAPGLPSCASRKAATDALVKDRSTNAREIATLPTTARFYLNDWQRSPLVEANAKGQAVTQTAYHPYGSVRRTTAELDPWSLAGNEKDEATGLEDFRARPYRAELGAFLSPDPVAVFEVEKTIEEPAGLGAYAYASGDPVNRVDWTGRSSVRLVAFSPGSDVISKAATRAQQAMGQSGRYGVDYSHVALQLNPEAMFSSGIPPGGGRLGSYMAFSQDVFDEAVNEGRTLHFFEPATSKPLSVEWASLYAMTAAAQRTPYAWNGDICSTEVASALEAGGVPVNPSGRFITPITLANSDELRLLGAYDAKTRQCVQYGTASSPSAASSGSSVYSHTDGYGTYSGGSYTYGSSSSSYY